MKTIYDKEYQVKYDILFKDAYDVLVENNLIGENDPAADGISSLEQYFSHIGDFVELHSKNVSAANSNVVFAKYSKFLLLPMDEVYGSNVFSIDSASRVINIPSTFAKNGVSVTGDKLAETLLFEVDRYFDVTDLVTTEIYIQWTNPRGEPGASRVSIVDYESKPGKIVFGWPLTDAITVEGSNPLKFSVRFLVKTDIGEIHYSLNTLPASVNIRQALYTNWDIQLPIDNANDLLVQAIKNGPAGDGADAAVPEFVLDLRNFYVLDENDCIIMETSIKKADSGVLTNRWRYQANYIVDNVAVKSDTVDAANINGIEITEEYVAVTEDTPEDYKTYYIEGSEGAMEIYDATLDGNTLPTTSTGAQVYQKNYRLTNQWDSVNNTHITGTYYMTSTNRVNGREVEVQSKTAVVPWVSSVVIDEGSDLQENLFLEDGKAAQLAVKVIATPGVPDGYKGLEDELPAITPTYEWYSSSEHSELVEDDIMVDSSNSLSVSTAGWYKVRAFGELNKESMYVDSQICRVLEPISAPVITKNSNGVYSYDAGDIITLEIAVEDWSNEKLKSDSISYQWYRQEPDASSYTPIANDDGALVAGSDVNSASIAINTGASSFKPLSYQCIITNTLAGQTKEVVSKAFYLDENDA